MAKTIYRAPTRSSHSLELQVAALSKAVKTLAGIIHTYTLPALIDTDVTKVRARLSDIHTQLTWAERQ